MNKEDRIIEVLEEIRDILKGRSTPVDVPTQNTEKESTMSHLPGQWDNFFQSKETSNPYYIIALAVWHLTGGDSDRSVEKKELKPFLQEEVSEMNGRDISQDITHTLTTYGYIGNTGRGKYKVNATTRKIVFNLPNEDLLKNLPKRYGGNRKKKHGKKSAK